MALNEEQKARVAQWYAAGATLDEMQKRIQSEFGIHLTYLDLRLLVADLPQPVEPESEVQSDESAGMDVPAVEPEASDVPPAEDAAAESSASPADLGEATPIDVSVTVDALTIPGTMASGDVTFSDGKTGKWYLDQMGRMGLGGDGLPPGYQPTQPDMLLFRQRLMEALQARGLY